MQAKRQKAVRVGGRRNPCMAHQHLTALLTLGEIWVCLSSPPCHYPSCSVCGKIQTGQHGNPRGIPGGCPALLHLALSLRSQRGSERKAHYWSQPDIWANCGDKTKVHAGLTWVTGSCKLWHVSYGDTFNKVMLYWSSYVKWSYK